jgi:hypothetical protein
MADLFRNTGLGQFIGFVSANSQSESATNSSLSAKSQNYNLCLKLESQRIVADFLAKQDSPRPSSDSVSTQSGESLAALRCGAIDGEQGWDGPDDPEIHSDSIIDTISI